MINDPDRIDQVVIVIMSRTEPNALPAPAFNDEKHHIRIYQGDCLEILAAIPEGTVDLVFADPRGPRAAIDDLRSRLDQMETAG